MFPSNHQPQPHKALQSSYVEVQTWYLVNECEHYFICPELHFAGIILPSTAIYCLSGDWMQTIEICDYEETDDVFSLYIERR